MTADVAVVGGGPAGYTAALYAARAGFSVVVFEGGVPGGQMVTTDRIENVPGIAQIDGVSLALAMQENAQKAGAETRYETVTSMELGTEIKTLVTSAGSFTARAVILAMGAAPRKLGLENEEKLTGRGVSYCATCDGMFFKGKTVAVIGGGDSAAADALVLSNVCEKVYLVHRRDRLRAGKAYEKPLMERENIEFVYNAAVERLLGEDSVEGLDILQNGTRRVLPVCGVFAAIGRVPRTDSVRGILPLDEQGYLIAGEDTKTPIPGVFAAGDVRKKPLRQIVTAAADGAVAAQAAERYLL